MKIRFIITHSVSNRMTRIYTIITALMIFSSVPIMVMAEQANVPVLKVCADPYLMPFSNMEEQGAENKIAELFAKDLGAELEYAFFPQRMGFIRNTLRADLGDGTYKCDLVISAPVNFDLADTTPPYYTSTYVLTYAKGRGLDAVTSPDKLAELVNNGKKIKFGLFDRGPAQLWVFKQGLMDYMVPYVSQPGGLQDNPGMNMMQDILDGKIDVSIVWGPVAGYFARQNRDKAEFVMLLMEDDPDNAEMRFKYGVSMAVRYGEKAWKEQVANWIENNQGKIEDILKDYGFPLLPNQKVNDDDD